MLEKWYNMLLGQSWKSSLSAWVVVALVWVATSPEDFQQWPWLVKLAKYLAMAGYIAKGRMQRDVDVPATVTLGGSKDKP